MKVPSVEEYRREKFRLALDFCPRIYPCMRCGYPVVDGFCCTYCGDTNPNDCEQNPTNLASTERCEHCDKRFSCFTERKKDE